MCIYLMYINIGNNFLNLRLDLNHEWDPVADFPNTRDPDPN
jgi:hypothetical protein